MLNPTRLLLAAFLIGTLYLTMPVAGQEWTRFRGPNGTGVSHATTIPTKWTAEDYVWRVELPGEGYSSPVIWGDRIFVSASIQEDGSRILACLDRKYGRTLWKRTFSSMTFNMGQAKVYDASSPTVDEKRVYLMWATPEHYIVRALDQANGEEFWQRDLGPFLGDHGFGASPILYEDLLIVPNDQSDTSSIVALDRATGKTRWKVDRRTARTAYSTPMIYRPKEGPPQLILANTSHGLSSLNPRTGQQNWEVCLFDDLRVVGSPVFASGLIFASCGSGGGGKRMYAFRPADAGNATEAAMAYELKGSIPYVPTPIARDDLLFLWHDQGVVTCLNAPTGEIHWKERVGGTYFGSPIRVRDRIYCISRQGEMIVLAASNQYKVLARIDLEEPSNSTPAIADGVMYLRTISHLAAIGGSSDGNAKQSGPQP